MHDTDQPASMIRRNLGQKVRRAIFIYVLIPYITIIVIFVIFQRRLLYPNVAVSLAVADCTA